MTQHLNPRSASATYFSAVRLAAMFGGTTNLCAAMRSEFNLDVKFSTVAGWVHRKHVPGPIIAHMMAVNPAFPFPRILASAVEQPATLESLLS